MKLKEINTLQDLSNFLKLFIDNDKDPARLFFEVRNLYKLIKSKESQYRSFSLPLRRERYREIHAPSLGMKKVQQVLNTAIQSEFNPQGAAFGYIKKRDGVDSTIISHAKNHVGKKYIINLDIKNFFPSIHFGRIRAVLQLPPLNLSPEGAHLIANICCLKGGLPQGGPSSPILSHLVCQRLDRKLVKIAKQNRFFYSRYADDLTFSSNVDPEKTDILEQVKKAVESEGFELNNKKTNIRRSFERQIVTGLVVNEKINVKKNFLKDIRLWLKIWENLGKDEAQKVFLKKKKNYYFLVSLHKTVPGLEYVLSGKIEFLRQVKGDKSLTYKKVKERFERLVSINKFPRELEDVFQSSSEKEGLEGFYNNYINSIYPGKKGALLEIYKKWLDWRGSPENTGHIDRQLYSYIYSLCNRTSLREHYVVKAPLKKGIPQKKEVIRLNEIEGKLKIDEVKDLHQKIKEGQDFLVDNDISETATLWFNYEYEKLKDKGLTDKELQNNLSTRFKVGLKVKDSTKLANIIETSFNKVSQLFESILLIEYSQDVGKADFFIPISLLETVFYYVFINIKRLPGVGNVTINTKKTLKKSVEIYFSNIMYEKQMKISDLEGFIDLKSIENKIEQIGGKAKILSNKEVKSLTGKEGIGIKLVIPIAR